MGGEETLSQKRLSGKWRIAIFLGTIVTVWIAGNVAVAVALVFGYKIFAGRSFTEADAMALPALAGLSMLSIANIVIVFLFRRLLDRRSIGSLGFGHAPKESLLWIIGMAGGGGLIVLMIGTVAALDGLHMGPPPSAGLGMALTYALILLAPTLSEEVIVRGYLLTNLEEGVGAVHGVVISSLIFAAFHVFNPGQEGSRLLVAANIFLAGVLLGIVYLRTRSLPAVWGIHFGWNYFLGPVFGIPVSGVRMEPLVPVSVHLAPQIGGGDFGLEGGVVCTVVVSAAILAAWGLLPTSRNP